MKFVELQNTKGTRTFTIWGGVAVHTNADGSEYHKELDASDLFNGTVLDNVKALVGADKLNIKRHYSSKNCNGTSLYIKLDGAKYELIELKGWEL